jgi:hypothetical protein
VASPDALCRDKRLLAAAEADVKGAKVGSMYKQQSSSSSRNEQNICYLN